MRVLVAYASRHGSTMEIAQRIAAELQRHDIPTSFKRVGEPIHVDMHQAFVIGSSVYLGRWDPRAADFIRRHADLLSTRPVWLFCSGPVGKADTARPKEFDEFADLIRPRDMQVFGGVFDPARKDASIGERLILKMPPVRRTLSTGDFRDWDAIESWAERIAREVRPGKPGSDEAEAEAGPG